MVVCEPQGITFKGSSTATCVRVSCPKPLDDYRTLCAERTYLGRLKVCVMAMREVGCLLIEAKDSDFWVQ